MGEEPLLPSESVDALSHDLVSHDALPVEPVVAFSPVAQGEPSSAPLTVPVEIERVPIEAALAVGWQLMKKNILVLMATSTLAGILMAVPGIVHTVIRELANRNYFLLACLATCFLVVPPLYYLGRVKVSLRLRRSEPFTSDDFVNGFPMFFHFLLMVFCRAVVLFFAYLAFIIPGMILQARFEYADYFIIDRRENAFKAMNSSWRVTQNSTMMLILFGVTCHFVETLGLLALVVGLVPAKWMTLIARSYVYDRLCETAPNAALPASVVVQTEVDSPPSLTSNNVFPNLDLPEASVPEVVQQSSTIPTAENIEHIPADSGAESGASSIKHEAV